jgi:hypothetical protein
MNYPIISPIIKTDDIYIIGHSKGGVSALLYCTQYDTKIYVLGQVRLIFTVRGIQKLEQWRADGVQYIKMLEPNDAFGSILTDLESNEEKYSLSYG